LASSFDSIGPITHDARDAALVLEAIAGHDPFDSTARQEAVPSYAETAPEDLAGLTLGVPVEYFGEGLAPGVADAIATAVDHMEDLGAAVEEVSLPHTRYAIPVYYTILFAEASANLARFDGVRFGLSEAPEDGDVIARMLQTRERGFGDEVKRRIMLGTFALSSGYYDAYYLRAQRVRTLLRQDFERAFERVDALVAPVCPTTAFRLGEKIDDPLAMYLSDIHVVAANPAGVPALALPCGFAPAQPDGVRMPVGMQVIGPPMGEPLLFRIGQAYQQTTDWHRARPVLGDPDGGDEAGMGGGQ
jgi:aspartyl-tRNA(Asn)/glutamyl-tRNA(Gln) amidotransferase subunit A